MIDETLTQQPAKKRIAMRLLGAFVSLAVSLCIISFGASGLNSSAIDLNDPATAKHVYLVLFLLGFNLLLLPFILRFGGARQFSVGYWFGTISFVVLLFGLLYFSKVTTTN